MRSSQNYAAGASAENPDMARPERLGREKWLRATRAYENHEQGDSASRVQRAMDECVTCFDATGTPYLRVGTSGLSRTDIDLLKKSAMHPTVNATLAHIVEERRMFIYFSRSGLLNSAHLTGSIYGAIQRCKKSIVDGVALETGDRLYLGEARLAALADAPDLRVRTFGNGHGLAKLAMDQAKNRVDAALDASKKVGGIAAAAIGAWVVATYLAAFDGIASEKAEPPSKSSYVTEVMGHGGDKSSAEKVVGHANIWLYEHGHAKLPVANIPTMVGSTVTEFVGGRDRDLKSMDIHDYFAHRFEQTGDAFWLSAAEVLAEENPDNIALQRMHYDFAQEPKNVIGSAATKRSTDEMDEAGSSERVATGKPRRPGPG